MKLQQNQQVGDSQMQYCLLKSKVLEDIIPAVDLGGREIQRPLRLG